MPRKVSEPVYEAQLGPIKELFGKSIDIAEQAGYAKGIQASLEWLRMRAGAFSLANAMERVLLPTKKEGKRR